MSLGRGFPVFLVGTREIRYRRATSCAGSRSLAGRWPGHRAIAPTAWVRAGSLQQDLMRQLLMGETSTNKQPLILKAEGVHKSYRMGATRVKVLKGVDLALREGESVAVIGASGSGKSTLLHILGGLDRPDKGAVSFNGRDLNRMRAAELNKLRNEMVGFVFQFYHLLDELNVLENVFLPAMVSRGVAGWLAMRKDARARAQELLDQMGLRERQRHKPYQLSGGERQRVAIGRALMNRPRLLLADEPTGNLDSATGNDILKVFERLNQAGQTIVMVTHDERVARKAGRVITLVDGKIES